MENTPENKERFFTTYWGQDVCQIGSVYQLKKVDWLIVSQIANYKSILHLTPLHLITDEDAIQIAMLLVKWPESMSKLTNINIRGRQDGDHVWDELILEFGGSFNYSVRYRGGDWLGWIKPNGRCEWTLFNHQVVYDYLRSKGYALPYLDLSVEELVSYGWVKLKDK